MKGHAVITTGSVKAVNPHNKPYPIQCHSRVDSSRYTVMSRRTLTRSVESQVPQILSTGK